MERVSLIVRLLLIVALVAFYLYIRLSGDEHKTSDKNERDIYENGED